MPDHHRYTGARRGAALVAVTALGLVAIIGSGGGGGSSAPPVEFLTITSDNATDVATLVISSGGTSLVFADAGGGVDPLAAPGGGAGAAVARLAPQTRRQILAAAVGPVTEPCVVAGTVRLSGNIADPDALTVGDRITAVFSGCDNGEGEVLNGQLSLTVRTIQGDVFTDVYLLAADMTLSNLRLTSGTESFTADGAFRLTEDSLAFPVLTTRITGNRIELRTGGDVVTLTNFTETLTTETGAPAVGQVFSAVGTVASRVLDGKVDYRTTADLAGPVDDAPGSGELLITGSGNTSVRVTVVTNNVVSLNLDLDGNGTVDEVQWTSWGELGGVVASGS